MARPDIEISRNMSRRNSKLVEPMAQIIDDKIYVAVGNDLKENKSTLLWALQHSGGRKICILHVHLPSKMIPMSEFGAEFPASRVEEEQVNAYRKIERQNMHKILDAYVFICHKVGVTAEKHYIETDCIEKGIVELVSLLGTKKLVMGAAADMHYSRKMIELKSKKAIYVHAEATSSCCIWFVCKMQLIQTREGILGTFDEGVKSLPQTVISNTKTQQHQLENLSYKSAPAGQDKELQKRNAENFDLSGVCSEATGQASNPHDQMSSSQGFGIHSQSSNEFSAYPSSTELVNNTGGNDNSLLFTLPRSDEGRNSSTPCLLKGCNDDKQAEISNCHEFEDSGKCGKAEKAAIEAFHRARTLETLYVDELKLGQEVKDTLAKRHEKLETARNQQSQFMKELQVALDKKFLLEIQISNSDQAVKELEEKIISAVGLLQNYKKEIDELLIERDNALKEAGESRKKQVGNVIARTPQFFSEFSFLEIKEATQSFHPSLKIGEGSYGSIYKGVLRHTEVAIKILRAGSSQGPSKYQREVEVLSKLRHPNLLTLVGVCPETWALIYEYIPNGSLDDRLSCKNNTAPLSWQTRICIADDLCSVLIFLNSIRPHGIVHGDLKPANIYLDANFVIKLGDFGICRVISQDGNSTNDTSFCRIDPKGTFCYTDPEFFATGELTEKSDVYSFGVILLQLLTGKPPLGIAKEVQDAVEKGNLNAVLDLSAGDWPFVLAKQLLFIALRCCEVNRKNRPDLALEAWRVSWKRDQIPWYYVCPVFQEIMQDPHVAADGYTYEAEAIKAWIDGGNEISPMTSEKLSHINFVPNLALRSAIQDWSKKS